MSDNIIQFGGKVKTFLRSTVRIKYMDSTEEDIECTFFGTSVDNPEFMIFSNAHPDSDEEADQIPELMINVRNVKSVRVIQVDKVER